MSRCHHGYKRTLEADNTQKGNILIASVDDNGIWTVGIIAKNDAAGGWHEDVYATRPIWEGHKKWQGLAEEFKIDPDEWNKFREYVKQEESNTKTKQSKVEDHPNDSRPEIIITNRHMQDITADALPAIVAHNTPSYNFVRAGCLVRIREDEHGTLGIEALNEPALRGILARSGKFIEVRDKKKSNADPPLKVVKDILALTSWDGIPPLVGLIESPVIRPDGSIVDDFGYDAATQLYYASGQNLELKVRDNPRQEDAKEAALFILSEVFSDFPFKDAASKANAMAALLTIIAKPLIQGNIPLGLFDKPQAGTGAGLLTEVIAEITTGKPAHLQTAPSSDDEWRKSITSTLMNGPSIVVIDNVDNMLKSRSLSQMLTARIWVDRMLGQSKMLHLPQTAAWFATGNNIQMGGDIARRAYWIRLDAEVARPWLRGGFKHNPLIDWVREHRSDILSKLLIMVRAWFVAGRPQANVLLLGSFNEWCRVIGDILAFAGVDGFLGNASQLYDNADQEIAQWDLFLGEWRNLHWNTPITASVLKADLTVIGKDAEMYRALQSEMPEDIIKATGKESRGTQALGVVLRSRADQIFPSGRKLVSEFDTHTKAQKWTVIEEEKKNVDIEKQESEEKNVDGKIDNGKKGNPDTQIPERPDLGIIDNSKAAGSSDPSKSICSGDFAGTCGEQKNPKQLLDYNIVENHYRVDSLPALPANEGLDGVFGKPRVPANLGLQEFKEGIKKRKCIKCGRSFLYDLSIHFKNGYLCWNCHSGCTSEQKTQPDAQMTLNDLERATGA
jgi:hypothetical protein